MVAHLSPARDARLNTVANGVERNFLGQFVHKIRTLGAWAHQTHVAFEDAENLRQLIDPQFANDLPDASHAIVFEAGPLRLSIFFSIGAHAAKLDHVEGLAVEAYSLLAIENRALALQHNQQRRDEHEGQRHGQQNQRSDDIDQPFASGSCPALVEAVTKNKPTRVDVFNFDLAQGLLKVGGNIVDTNAVDLAIQQLAHGHAAAATLGECHHNFINIQTQCGFGQRLVIAQYRRHWNAGLVFIDTREIAHDFCVRIIGLESLPHQSRRSAGPKHHDAGARASLAAGMGHVHAVCNHCSNPKQRRPLDRVTIGHVYRQQTVKHIFQRKHQEQSQHGPRTGLVQRAVRRALVEAGCGVDDEHRQSQHDSVGHRVGHSVAQMNLGQHCAQNCCDDETKVEQDLHQRSTVQVVIEDAYHFFLSLVPGP